VLTKRATEGLPFLAKSSKLHAPWSPVQQELDSASASPTGRTVLAKTVELSEAVSAIGATATELCTGLSAEQLSWRPKPQKWSIAQNLAHLRTTTCVFLPVVDSAIEKSTSCKLLSDGPFRLTPYGRLLVWQMDSRPIIKLQAPKPTQPQLLDSSDHELEYFLISQAELQQRIERAQGLDLTALRFPSPLARCLRVNLLEFFALFNAHSRRHLRQAEKVRQTLLRTL
jgi:DinB superfamily